MSGIIGHVVTEQRSSPASLSRIHIEAQNLETSIPGYYEEARFFGRLIGSPITAYPIRHTTTTTQRI